MFEVILSRKTYLKNGMISKKLLLFLKSFLSVRIKKLFVLNNAGYNRRKIIKDYIELNTDFLYTIPYNLLNSSYCKLF